jgi:murein DD-endopeptidase MepM/ murein hydrolase activator NlpD
VIPVPGHSITTPYGARSRLWSCNRNAAGEGIHTGCDLPASVGSHVVAARPGIAVYAFHGSAFGFHQLEIHPGDGTRDFYAHMIGRTVANGQHVEAGQHVGYVGAEGHVTGPHLHFERHAVATGIWSCGIIRDPQPSIDYQEDDMPLNDHDLAKIKSIVKTEVHSVFDQKVNELSGKSGEDIFVGMTFRDVIKGIYRKVSKG